MSDSDSNCKKRSERKHRKKEKKHKKDKKQKHNKRSRKTSTSETPVADNCIAMNQDAVKTPEDTTIGTTGGENTETALESFGPALPPHLLKAKSTDTKKNEVSVIGPSLPDGIVLQTEHESCETSEDDDGEELCGPLPTDRKSFTKMTTAQIRLEERALEIKLARLDPDANKEEINAREEWMLELPDVGLKTGLASLKRTFHTKERPDFSDRTSWTKTPNSSDVPTSSKVTETTKSKAEENYQAQRDAEQEKIAKKLKKKHKRDESLYEIHQKKVKKDKKEKEVNGKLERRPFSRDVDLQLNKIDKNQTKKIVDKAKFLDSRFSSGNAKYL